MSKTASHTPTLSQALELALDEVTRGGKEWWSIPPKHLAVLLSAAKSAAPALDLLELVRAEATKFGRCCDLYQDGFGTFADHECQQRTFAMLRGVQQVLGFDKGGNPLTDAEIVAARDRAKLHYNAPGLLGALKELLEAAVICEDDLEFGEHDEIVEAAKRRARIAIENAAPASQSSHTQPTGK